ncbi:MAG: hypothetical protein ABI615_11760 [Chthoniobacterales bacterium]
MKITALFIAMFLMATCDATFARESLAWSYEALTEGADLIVIAHPTAVLDTHKETVFPNIFQNEKPVPGIVMEATLEILSVLKGTSEKKTIVLQYFREPEGTNSLEGPRVLSFDPAKRNCYLMFLKRDKDGRYSALSGQTDPADAVKDIGNSP